MEFRKMAMMTLYARQQKRHSCIEQAFGLRGRGRGWDDFGEWHWNMYNIIYETNHQSRFDAWYWMLGAGALGRPEGWYGEGGVRGVLRVGNTCTPVADSCWRLPKPMQHCKVERNILCWYQVFRTEIFKNTIYNSTKKWDT